MGYCGLVMFVLGLIIETKAWGIFFNVIFELKNWLLLSLVGGCLLTTIDKLSSIFLTMRNSIIDWAIIQDAKTPPKIILDVLINNKYPFDAYSISGGVIIVIAEILWGFLAPSKKVAGEGIIVS